MLGANEELRALCVEKRRWLSLECLENSSVLMESKDGRYELPREEEVMEK